MSKDKWGFPKTYPCSKCGRRHRWDSDIGSKHANHNITLSEMEIPGFFGYGPIVIMDVLASHYYNPHSIEYVQNMWVKEGDWLRLQGDTVRRQILWDGEYIQTLGEEKP